MSTSDTLKGLLALGLPTDSGEFETKTKETASAIVDDSVVSNQKVYSSSKIEARLAEITALSDEIDGEADTFAELPSAASKSGKIYSVLNSTGAIGTNRKSAGLYRSNGTVWSPLSDFDAFATQLLANSLAIEGKEPSIQNGTQAQYLRGDKTWQYLNKGAVGLGNVDNTADIDKPVSNATQQALDGKEPSITAGDQSHYISGDKTLRNFALDVSDAQAQEMALKADKQSLAAVATSGKYSDLSEKPEIPTALSSFTNDAEFQTRVQVQDVVDLISSEISSKASSVELASEVSARIAADLLFATKESTYTKAETNSAIQAVIGAAPEALNTLQEIASQLVNNESAVAAITTSLAAKAPSNNPVFTGDVLGVTAAMVGLGNVNNTSDADKPVSNAQAALNATFLTSNNPLIVAPIEKINLSSTGANGIVNIDVATAGVWYFTSMATANFTLNLRGNTLNTIGSLLAVGQAVSVSVLNTSGSTAYYPSAIQIDGVAVTPKYVGGTPITAGSPSSIDIYSFTVIKTGANAYTVLANQSKAA